MSLNACIQKEKEVKAILGLIAQVHINGSPAPFVAAEKFREGEIVDGVKVLKVGPNFRKWLLHKTEWGTRPGAFRIWKPSEDAFTDWILEELGLAREIMLGQLWRLIVEQGKAPGGLLYGKTNVGFICDGERVLRPVRSYWHPMEKGVEIEAFPPSPFFKWTSDRQIISR